MSARRMHPDDLAQLVGLLADRLDLEALADLLAAKLRDESAPSRPAPALLTTTEAADRLGRSAEWVRDNRDRLGAISLGTGPRPRLGFSPAAVDAFATARDDSKRSPADESPMPPSPPQPRRRRAAGTDSTAARLLPIRRPGE